MNKIILKGLLSCVVMSQALALSAGDPDLLKSPEINLEKLLAQSPNSAVKELLGDYADLKITSTPVKTKVVQGDIVSPTFKNAISSLRNLHEDLNLTKDEAARLSLEIESQKSTMQALRDQIVSLETDSNQKAETIESLNTTIGKMIKIQKDISKKYRVLANDSGSLEASTALKMKIHEEIQNIRQNFLSEAKEKYTNTEDYKYIANRYAIETVAYRLVISIEDKDNREANGLKEIYDNMLKVLNADIKANRSTSELSDESKNELLNIFESLMDNELKAIENAIKNKSVAKPSTTQVENVDPSAPVKETKPSKEDEIPDEQMLQFGAMNQ